MSKFRNSDTLDISNEELVDAINRQNVKVLPILLGLKNEKDVIIEYVRGELIKYTLQDDPLQALALVHTVLRNTELDPQDIAIIKSHSSGHMKTILDIANITGHESFAMAFRDTYDILNLGGDLAGD